MANDIAPHYRNRVDAGKRLAADLDHYRDRDVVVFAIPRGGIPVAIEVAKALECNLDIVVPRKIPIPYNTEGGYGAVTEDGVLVLNNDLVSRLNLTIQQVEYHAEEVRYEILRRTSIYRANLKPLPIEGKTAIIVDDGLASGYTMMAAIKSIRKKGRQKLLPRRRWLRPVPGNSSNQLPMKSCAPS